ncbi:restriction endonuclease subunit S [Campylobacter hyointestinalis]|uniref:restriction endonuclease subunit S n=1 Tax=Campylobacter hyointestinalis TaxID=198 RepID=UPI000DCEA249|nr:restriction endonuclease subunit S [Campylobacter hyointestinalis]RAZ54680.1 restriction endonuclease subunit S [Campylobacter hyointestinalis subsp. lawsonii]RAZ63996.1 restriction endonuclease subunit S [Campylobacter hyointestinalis subsp. lawsonii]
MGKLDELINKLCPNGVEFKTLGELGKFYGGLTGKSKEDFNKGNAKFITYKNVYENLSLKIDVEDRVNVGENEKQRTLEYGDIIFTGSSETSDECGISSVLTQKTEEKLYLNSFCFFLRLNDKNLLNPDFTKHLFRSSNLRYQIGKTASGVTRFNVSKKAMERVCIPVPPLEVQCEIVRILDNFTLLSAELSAELSARQKQYNYYRDKLLNKIDEFEIKNLEDCCNILDNKRKPVTKSSRISGNIPYYGANGIQDYVSEYIFDGRFVLVGEDGSVVNQNGNPIVNWAEGKIWVNNHAHIIEETIVDLRYLYYYIQTINVRELIHGNIPKLNQRDFRKLRIKVPSKEKQKEITDILDRFDKLCNDLSEGLPAEIEARKKQYEYYRDKLLTFKELKAN